MARRAFCEISSRIAPLFRIGLFVIRPEDLICLFEIDLSHGRDRQAQRMTFKGDPDLEQLDNFIDRHIRYDHPAIGQERNESLGLQLLERFPHRNTASSEPFGQFVLPELKSGRKLTRLIASLRALRTASGVDPCAPVPRLFADFHPIAFSALLRTHIRLPATYKIVLYIIQSVCIKSTRYLSRNDRSADEE